MWFLYVCVYVCVCMYIYVCMYVCTYTHTHTYICYILSENANFPMVKNC